LPAARPGRSSEYIAQVGVMSNTLINVSNRLPVTVETDKIRKSAGGFVAALNGLSKEQYTTNGLAGLCRVYGNFTGAGDRARSDRRIWLRAGVSQHETECL
jgi:trehalose-6-phosphate synthase